MPLTTFGKCWRGRDDCESFTAVEAPPPGLSEDEYYGFEWTPVSFVCSGCIREGARQVPQDAYRVCFKNACSDEISDNDEQDLTHLAHVIGQALATIATRRVHQPEVRVLGDAGVIDVPSKQFAMMQADAAE